MEALDIKLKIKIQIVVDVFMTFLLPISMAYSMIGELLHEYLGIAMMLLFIVHHALNVRWFSVLFRGRYTSIRIFGTIINVLLLFNVFSLMISGIIISQYALDFLPIARRSSFARILHLISSYWSFVLMSIHLGLHWNTVIGRIQKWLYITKHASICKKFLQLFSICFSVYGMYAFVFRKFDEYLFFKSRFVFFDFNEPLFFFLIDYLAIMFLFGTIGYCFRKRILLTKK